VTEELSHIDAQREHEILRQALDSSQDHNLDTGKTVGVKKQFLRDVRNEMLALDPKDTPALLETLDRYLHEYDSSEEDFGTMAEYLPYRVPNAGYRSGFPYFLIIFKSTNCNELNSVCCHFTRWSMNIHLTDQEYESIREFEWTLGEVLALTNDYYSWQKEKLQSTDRIRNGVHVLMREYNLPQEQARSLLRGMIIDLEEKAKTLKMERLKNGPPMSNDLKRYMEALEIYAGGNCYWSATCPRYNKPQESEDVL